VRSFLDAPRQLGIGVRKAHAHLPMVFFTFVTNYIEVGNGYVVAESNGNVIVYDSVSSASRILNIDRRQLSDAVSSGSSHNGSTWRESRPLEFTRMMRLLLWTYVCIQSPSTLLKLAVNRVGRAKS
jgi:hypothetical protein